MRKSLPAYLKIILLLGIPCLFGIVSVYLGKDANWDLRNYHYYDAYAFLNHRMGWDIGPAQLQTFLNPLIDLPFFWMANWLPARVIGFVLGSVQGLNVSLIFLIFWNSIELESVPQKCLLGIFVAALSAFAPGFLSEIGTTINDNSLSLFVLAALLMLILESKTLRAGYGIALAGLLLGIGVGLKLTLIIYAIGSGLALPLLFDKWRLRVRALFLYSAGGIVGVAATAAAWSGQLWTTFGNPLLPFYNNVFRSPYVPLAPYADPRFLPKSLFERLVWPVVFSWDTTRVAEIKFSDVRFALLYLLILFVGMKLLFNSIKGGQIPRLATHGTFEHRPAGFLFVFFVTSFVVWMNLFSIYRYIIALELLVPICAAIVMEQIAPPPRARLALGAALTVLVLAAYSPLHWGRTAWSNPYLLVDTSRFPRNAKSIVIMLGGSPTSYAIPFFPPGMRFVRPDGNLKLTAQALFMQEIEGILMSSQDRNFYVFYDRQEPVDPVKSISKLGIDAKMQECFPLASNLPDQLEICKFSRP